MKLYGYPTAGASERWGKLTVPPNDLGQSSLQLSGFSVASIIGVGIILMMIGALTVTVLTSRRLEGSSLFNRLFIIVAVTSGFFSAVSSAIGFGLITSQESTDFFRNSILPPAFGAFVFFLAVAIWVGGAELVRERDWFREIKMGNFRHLILTVFRPGHVLCFLLLKELPPVVQQCGLLQLYVCQQ